MSIAFDAFKLATAERPERKRSVVVRPDLRTYLVNKAREYLRDHPGCSFTELAGEGRWMMRGIAAGAASAEEAKKWWAVCDSLFPVEVPPVKGVVLYPDHVECCWCYQVRGCLACYNARRKLETVSESLRREYAALRAGTFGDPVGEQVLADWLEEKFIAWRK